MPGFGGADRWTKCLNLNNRAPNRSAMPVLIGLLRGEGVGPEIIAAALDVLDAVAKPANLKLEICEIGREAKQRSGNSLPQVLIAFCQEIFARGGAVLHGPCAGRFVYDLRKEFDLFFKISPLQAALGVPHASRLKPDATRRVDILITRENTGGVYQGRWGEENDPSRGHLAWHSFSYSEEQARRFLRASAQLSAQRRGDLVVVWKEAGLPSISALWRSVAEQAAKAAGVCFRMIDLDVMAYWLIQEPQAFDVVAAPNLVGDILADLGAVLLGSRGVSFSGNFNAAGNAAYQTNHGSAHDLSGTDRANPGGQIFALAMMLRESFGLLREAAAIEAAVRSVWSEGWRTEEVAMPGSNIVGTREMGYRVAERAAEILESGQRQASVSVGDETASHPG